MADTDQREVCKRIATAMGWKFRKREGTVDFWYQPNGVFYTELPDFFADPVAADALMRWLDDNGYTWQLGNEREKSFKIQHYAAVEKDGATVVGYHQLSSSWSIALALAADAAIKEAAK